MRTSMDEAGMNESGRALMGTGREPAVQHPRAQSLATDLNAIARLGIDGSIAARLQLARRAALARLGSGVAPSGHWINWAPVGFAMVLVLATSWTLLVDNAQSLDADLLADALPFDAYLDAEFESSIDRGGVELIEN